MCCGNAANLCCDKGSAELDQHVFEGRLVLGAIPGLGGAAPGEVVAMVAIQGVPEYDEAVDGELERHGAFDRELQPVAGLADAEDGAE